MNFSETLKETRPTAINLAWAVDRVISLLKDQVESMSSMSEVVRPHYEGSHYYS